MDTTHVKHGMIAKCTRDGVDGLNSTLNGISVSSSVNCSSIDPAIINDATEHNGVEVLFDEPFDDIPSVIVTQFAEYPATNITSGCSGATNTHIPRCLVESITESSAVVKCVMILECASGGSMYYPIPFTFVAVGY